MADQSRTAIREQAILNIARVHYEVKRYKSAIGHVYVCEGGPSGTMTVPEDFTDRGTPSATRPLTADLLADLAAVVSALRLTVDKDCREY